MSTSLWTCDDVRMVDECKQTWPRQAPTWRKYFQMNTFHYSLKEWMDLYRHCVYQGSYVKHEISIFKVNSDNQNGESPWRPWRFLICILTRGLCSYNARLFNDDVTAIGVCTRLHGGRKSKFAHIEMITAKVIKPVTLYPVSGYHRMLSIVSQTSAKALW